MKSKNNNPFHFTILGCCLVISGMFSKSARAATGSWTGLGADSLWSTNANWTGATPPGTGGQVATFNGAGNGKTIIDLGAGVSVSNIVFDTASAAAYTLGDGVAGSQTLTLNSNVTMNALVANDQTIAALLKSNGNNVITNSSTTKTLFSTGGITSNSTGTKALSFAATGAISVSGAITPGLGDISIAKSGAGTLTLSGSNSYTGATAIGAGAVIVNNSNSGGGSYSLTGANTTLTIGGGTVVASTVTTSANSSSRALNLNGGILQTTGNVFASGTAGAVTFNGGTLKSGNASGITISDFDNIIGIAAGGATLDTTIGNITSTALFSGGAAGAITIKGGNTFSSGISNTGLLTLQDNSIWDLNGIASSVAGLSGTNGTITNSGATQTLTTNFASGTNTFGGVISGGANLALSKSGAGIQILTGANTYTGNTTISGGALQIGNAGTTGLLSASSAITNNGNLTFNRTNAVVQGTDFGTITSGTGGMTQAGSNSLTLNTANTYSGGTTISNGTLSATASGALGSGTVVLPNGGGRFQISGNSTLTNAFSIPGVTSGPNSSATFSRIQNVSGTNEISGNITWNATGGIFTNILSTAGALTLSGNLTTAGITGDRTFNFAGAGNTSVSGVISNGSATVGLSKVDAGTLTLSGENTYTGMTSVSSGTLLINGNNLDATGAVTVATGATLGGTGTVGGATTIQSGGHLAVGNSPGTQTFNSDLTFASGSIFDWELDADPADTGTSNQGTYDKVVANGAVTGTSVFTIALGTNTFTNPFWDADKSWSNIFTTTASGTFNLASLFTTFGGAGVDTAGVVSGQGQFSFTGNTLNWSAVPEPGSALAGLLIAAGLLRRNCRA